MLHSTRTPEGEPNQCPVCGKAFVLEPSVPPGDGPCPHCGSLVWFPRAPEVAWTAGFPVYSLPAAEARTKEQAIRAVVGRLIEAGQLCATDCESIVSAILQRERLASTGVGWGLAMPHTTHPGVERVVGVLARLPGGVEFDAVDGQPVQLLCLLIAPSDHPLDYGRALEAVARTFRRLV